MAVSTADMNQIRVDVLGTTVDNPGATWTTAPPAAANRLNTAQRVINRAINDLDERLGGAINGTNGFSDRFSTVIGDEAGADQAAFDGLGSNLIQALAAGTGGGGFFQFQQPTAATSWSITHNLGFQFVAVRVLSPGSANASAPQNIVVPSIAYTDPTNCVLTFTSAVAGTAIVTR